ncbi:MAG: hypothetical protein ACXVA9_08390, partial [Bdellovibrionales bacterium]
AEGVNGMMIVNRRGTTIRAREVLMRTIMSPKAAVGRQEGEAGRTDDPTDPTKTIRSAAKKARTKGR